MKKISALLITLILAFALVGCRGAAPEDATQTETDSDGLFSEILTNQPDTETESDGLFSEISTNQPDTETESEEAEEITTDSNQTSTDQTTDWEDTTTTTTIEQPATHTNYGFAGASPTYDVRNESPTDVLDAFSKFLDQESIYPGLQQWHLDDLLKGYRYQGKSVYTHLKNNGFYYDTMYGGGKQASNEFFGYTNDFEPTKDLAYNNYSNGIFTNVPLEGLTLPMELTFEDTIVSALQKLGIEKGVADFVADETGAMPLLQNETDTLNWTVYEPGKIYSHQLKYEQVYQRTRSDGKTETVTRLVTLSFSGEENTLCRVDLDVHQKYPRS